MLKRVFTKRLLQKLGSEFKVADVSARKEVYWNECVVLPGILTVF